MSTQKPKRMALKLLLLLVLFILPMVAAILIYQARDNLHFLSKNVGELVIPSVNLSELGLEELPQRWWLAYYTPEACDQNCVDTLNHFDTMYQSMLKDQHRLGVVLITEKLNLLPQQFSQMPVLTLQEALPQQLLQDGQSTAIWIIDPISNIILSYDPQSLDNSMLIDLRHLLKVSQIG
jgi:hypothetical protein